MLIDGVSLLVYFLKDLVALRDLTSGLAFPNYPYFKYVCLHHWFLKNWLVACERYPFLEGGFPWTFVFPATKKP